MLRALTPQGAFGAYAGFNVVALVLIYLFVPETKQLTLEELDNVFSIPVSEQIRYQTFTVVPHWFRRNILRKKNEECPPIQLTHKLESGAHA